MNRKDLLKALYVGAGLVALAAPVGASAQVTGAESTSGFGLEEIVVTARKRTEQLQDAPVSVTAFSAASIEQRSIDSFNKVNNFVPNIELNNGRVDGGGSTAQIFIRGVGQEDYSFPNDPGVGVYLDGVYVSRSSAGDFGFLDIERIEVLRGPQGTLYGKNTIGGAINVISRRPSGDSKGRIEVTTGRYGRLDITGSADFRISDVLFGSISGASLNRKGFATNYAGDDLGNINKDAVRVQLRYKPDTDLDVVLLADKSRQRQFGAVGAMRQYYPFALEAFYNTSLAPIFAAQFGLTGPLAQYGPAWVNRFDKTKRFEDGSGTQTRDNNDIWGTSLTIDYDFGGAAFKSITAYRRVKVDVLRDGDHTPFRVVEVGVQEATRQFSQEFQISGKMFDDRLEYIFGLYGIRETGTNAFVAPLLAGIENILGDIVSLRTDTHIKSTSYAAFGEFTYNLTDQLGVTVGGRLNTDKKVYDYALYRIFSGALVNGPAHLTDKWTEFLPKFGIQYKIDRDILAYGTFSKSFKAGGWNPRTLSAGLTPQQFDPEYLTSYEAGLKTTLADGRVTFNVAGFYSNYKDIQLIGVTTAPDGGVDTTVLNGGKARIYGAEFELNARPVPELLLSAGLGLLKAKYLRLDPVVVATGVTTSNKLIQAPARTFNVQATYTVDLANSGKILLNGDAAYKSKIYRSIQNFPDLITPAYWIFNSRLTYVDPSEKYEIAAFVTNVTNKIYLANGVDVRALGEVEGYYNRPREWGLSVKARF